MYSGASFLSFIFRYLKVWFLTFINDWQIYKMSGSHLLEAFIFFVFRYPLLIIVDILSQMSKEYIFSSVRILLCFVNSQISMKILKFNTRKKRKTLKNATKIDKWSLHSEVKSFYAALKHFYEWKTYYKSHKNKNFHLYEFFCASLIMVIN